MKNKGVLIAVGVFALLLVVVLATREKQVSVGIRKLELKSVDKDTVTGFDVSGAKVAQLRKEGETWSVVDPASPAKKLAVDEYSIKSVVDAVPEIARGAEFVTDKADKHGEYEVDDAKGLRVKVLTGGGTAYDLVWGKFAKGGGSYVRIAGNDSVFASKARIGTMMKKDVSQWRKRQLLTTKAEEFKEITVKAGEGVPFTFVSEDGKEWKLRDGTATPAGFRFDAAAAARLSQNVATVRAQEFLDVEGAAKDDVLGLGARADVVTAVQKDGKTIVLEVGREIDSRVTTSSHALKGNFDAIDAAGTKDGKITAADVAAALGDKTRADDVKKALDAASQPDLFQAFDTGAWGMKAKDDAVTQDDLESVQKTGSLVPLRIQGDPQLYLAPSYAAQQLRKKLADYRDLGLLAFDAEKVKRIAINVGGKRTVAVKDGADWKVTEPRELPAGFEFDPAQVNAQASMLKSLKASRLVEPAPSDAQAGLAKPSGTVELELDDKKVVTLRFGAEVTNDKGAKEVYVRGNADNALYAVGEYMKKRMETGVELFRKPKPPPNMGGMGGGMQGLENLPPDIRKKLEAQLRQQQH